MLVIHGDKDYRVPVGEALRLWYDLGRFSILRGLDLFASVLFTQQFFQRLLEEGGPRRPPSLPGS